MNEAHLMEESKRRYLLALRDRRDLTPGEQHDLDIADAVYGDGWWLPKRERRWQELARAVGEFRQSAGRWPMSSAEDAEERRLGLWLASTRYRSGRKALGWTGTRAEYLDVVAPGWRGDDDPKWRAIADQVASFHRTHGFWPRSRADNKAELRLGQWLNAYRIHSVRGTGGWTTQRGEYLDEVAPGWRGDDARWRATADAVGAHRKATGHWPRSKSSDPEEQRLGRWLVGTRTNSKRGTGGWTDARGAYLDQAAPGWRGNDDPKWRAVADSLAVFQQTHHRWPRSKAAAADEARLGQWLAQQRLYEKKSTGGWTAARGAYLDEVAAGWRTRA